MRLSVSCTTRDPRPGEREGVEYYFVSAEQFEQMRNTGELLEWAEVYPGLHYGTPRGPVEQALARGEDIILEIDDQGAQSIRAILGEGAVLVFVAPPSFAELHRRLADRQTESPEQLRARLRTARAEIADMGAYDYVLVNDQVEPATARLEAILLAEQAACAAVDWQSLQAALLAEADEVLGGTGWKACATEAEAEVRRDG
jgi:guanylate kinase